MTEDTNYLPLKTTAWSDRNPKPICLIVVDNALGIDFGVNITADDPHLLNDMAAEQWIMQVIQSIAGQTPDQLPEVEHTFDVGQFTFTMIS